MKLLKDLSLNFRKLYLDKIFEDDILFDAFKLALPEIAQEKKDLIDEILPELKFIIRVIRND